MRKLLIILAGSLIMTSCNSNQKSSGSDAAKTDTSTSKPSAAVTQEKPEVKGNWTFTTDTDKMTSKERYMAVCEATNKLDFEAPYDGGSTATITLRNQNKQNEILLEIDKGQFICDVSNGCAINVRFDQNPAIKFTGTETSDGSSTVLFIGPEKKFIVNLKKAKKMIVQAEFYESGLKTMEFDVDGLKWNY